jgi:type VI secretion system secreted protein Hcp
MAAVDYFLKLDGIDGESTDDKHKNEIDILSFSWGLANATSGAGRGGAGAGKAVFQDFHFTTNVNKASPKLFLACAMGQHIKEAKLTCRKAGREQEEFLIVKMTDVLITSYQQGGASESDVVPTDQLSLNFAKIEVEYFPQKPDGTLDAVVKAGYDLKKNEKV